MMFLAVRRSARLCDYWFQEETKINRAVLWILIVGVVWRSIGVTENLNGGLLSAVDIYWVASCFYDLSLGMLFFSKEFNLI